ncbi:MAG: GTP cyclohydrolase I [Myxococcales bacterium]|nr:GTP cyclohydrolase I [Myxococcales bacterium]MCB9533432.1 GTP cyclohydrolase I [Myxococcales bacterium]
MTTTPPPPSSAGSPEEHFAAFLRALGLDVDGDPELRDTPARVTELLRERFDPAAPVAELSVIDTPPSNRDLVVVRDLRFHSLCVHHVTPFFGTCTVAFVPNGRLAGFGGIDRLVQSVARRPQLQERMVAQIADALVAQLAPTGVAVIARARQMCMELTGTHPGAETLAIARRGSLLEAGAWTALAPLLTP